MLWDKFKIYELNDIVRTDEPLLMDCLKKIRKGNEEQLQQAFDKIQKELGDRFVTVKKGTQIDTLNYTNDDESIFISATNEERNLQNSLVVNKASGRSILIHSLSSQNNTIQHFFVKTNTRITLSSNIYTEDHLVNGSNGIIQKIVKINCDTGGSTNYFLVKFDDELSGKKILHHKLISQWITEEDKEQGLIPITATSTRKCTICNKSVLVYPFNVAYGMTFHKAQGKSFDKIVLSFRKVNANNFGVAYVGISRVTKMSGLTVIDLQLKHLTVNEKVKESHNEMRQNQCLDIMLFSKWRCAQIKSESLFNDDLITPKLTVSTLNLKMNHKETNGVYLQTLEQWNASDILLLTETGCCDENDLRSIIKNDEFTAHVLGSAINKSSKRPRGVAAIFIGHLSSNEWCTKTLYLSNSKLVESCIIMNNWKKIVACAIYISPKFKLQKEENSIVVVVNIIKNFDANHIFIGGDFNGEENASHFIQIASANGLQLYKHDKEIRTHDLGKELDFILSNDNSTLLNIEVTQTLTSDHDLLSCVYSANGLDNF